LEIGRAGWLADYNDADNFLSLLKTGVEHNYGKWSNAEYDRLINDGNKLAGQARSDMFHKAEKIALDDSAALPIYYYLSENIVSPKIKGFVDNAFDIHRTRWLEKTE
jgi:oligopeptide transport system substrate-binding protein